MRDRKSDKMRDRRRMREKEGQGDGSEERQVDRKKGTG